MKDMEGFMPPSPAKVLDTAVGVVEDIAGKAQEISKYDPMNIAAGIVGDTAKNIRKGL